MQIRVEPDMLREIAGRQGAILDNIEQAIAKIDDIGGQLAEVWEGASGTEAMNSLSIIRFRLKTNAQNTSDSIRKIINAADTFENVDSGKSAIEIKFGTGLIPMPEWPKFILSVPGRIRIDTDGVRDVAKRCSAIRDTIADCVNEYSSTINALQNSWEGKSYLKYEEEAKGIIRGIMNNQESIDEFISKIEYAANRYEEIDNEL